MIYIAAFFSAMLAAMGVGGGMLLIMWLTIFGGYSQIEAQGINLLFFLPVALLSLCIHIKNKLIDIKLVGKYLIAGLPCAVLGSIAASAIDVTLLRKLFAVFLLFIGISQLFYKQKESDDN